MTTWNLISEFNMTGLNPNAKSQAESNDLDMDPNGVRDCSTKFEKYKFNSESLVYRSKLDNNLIIGLLTDSLFQLQRQAVQHVHSIALDSFQGISVPSSNKSAGISSGISMELIVFSSDRVLYSTRVFRTYQKPTIHIVVESREAHAMWLVGRVGW